MRRRTRRPGAGIVPAMDDARSPDPSVSGPLDARRRHGASRARRRPARVRRLQPCGHPLRSRGRLRRSRDHRGGSARSRRSPVPDGRRGWRRRQLGRGHPAARDTVHLPGLAQPRGGPGAGRGPERRDGRVPRGGPSRPGGRQARDRESPRLAQQGDGRRPSLAALLREGSRRRAADPDGHGHPRRDRHRLGHGLPVVRGPSPRTTSSCWTRQPSRTASTGGCGR